jgi:hypothetical protein
MKVKLVRYEKCPHCGRKDPSAHILQGALDQSVTAAVIDERMRIAKMLSAQAERYDDQSSLYREVCPCDDGVKFEDLAGIALRIEARNLIYSLDTRSANIQDWFDQGLIHGRG